ncbi:MAG: glycosyltransferase family 2 protein, partial [Bacilli bacterium]|nr:glycosyltransferase family 2 protein [Bacilli bacterium]
MIVVKVIYYILTVVSLAYILYFGLTGLFAFKKSKTRIKKFSDKTKFAILIAARNEANVVGNLVKSLVNQKYDSNLYDVYVLPNNCSDNTADAAREAGAKVLDVTVPVKCKGDVLKFAFAQLEKKDYDAYMVFDADNVVHPDFLHHMNNIYQSGYVCAQGRKDSKNMYDNWVSCSYSLFYSIQNLFFNKARTNVRMSATINGTGFMISKKFIDEVGFNPTTVTEDIELSIWCILNDVPVIYTDDAITYDEQPTGFGDSIKQRTRWSVGIIQCCKKYNKALFKKAIKDRDKSAMDKVLFNIAPYTQIISLIPFALLAVMNIRSFSDIGWALLTFDYTTLIAGYFISLAISVYTLQ